MQRLRKAENAGFIQRSDNGTKQYEPWEVWQRGSIDRRKSDAAAQMLSGCLHLK